MNKTFLTLFLVLGITGVGQANTPELATRSALKARWKEENEIDLIPVAKLQYAGRYNAGSSLNNEVFAKYMAEQNALLRLQTEFMKRLANAIAPLPSTNIVIKLEKE